MSSEGIPDLMDEIPPSEIRSSNERDKDRLLEEYRQRLAYVEAERDRLRTERHLERQEASDDYDRLQLYKLQLAEDLKWANVDLKDARREVEEANRSSWAWREEKKQMEEELQGWRNGDPDYLKLETESRRLAERYRQKSQEYNNKCRELIAMLEDAEKRYEDMHDKYSKALKERVERLREHVPPIPLPVEIMVNIAAFVADANHFGTLASMCATARFMQQECQPVLYETVIWNNTGQMNFECASRSSRNYPAVWRYVRYIVSDLKHSLSWRRVFQEAFPNIRASLETEYDPRSRFGQDDYLMEPPRYTAQLSVFRDTTIATLSSILRYPLAWNIADEPPSQSPILGISNIDIEGNACLRVGDTILAGSFTPTECGPYQIAFEEQKPDCERKLEQTMTTIRAMSLLALQPVTELGTERRVMSVVCNTPVEVEAWTQELRNWLEISPYTTPHLDICFAQDITGLQFLEYTRAFEDVYKSICVYLCEYTEQESEVDIDIFEFLGYDNNFDVRFQATFTRRTGWSGLRVKVEENTHNGPAREDLEPRDPTGTVVLDDHHYLPFGRRLITAGDEVDDPPLEGAVNDSADSTVPP